MEIEKLKHLLDYLVMQPSECEWIEFKYNFHSQEEIDPDSKSRKYASYIPFWA